MAKTVYIDNHRTRKQLRQLAENKGFTTEETIQFLLDIYNLECIDLLTRRVKEKHLAYELNLFQRAQLSVLASYINAIL